MRLRFTRVTLLVGLLAPMLSLLGCAHYEFELLRPPELARHVGDQRAETVSLDPLEYRMQSAEGHLVIKAFNPTGDTILLLGRMSSVVDAAGESHPLPERTLAPGSYVKLILPPLRPRLESYGPTIGVGFGVVGYRSRPYWGYPGWYRGYYDGGYYPVYEDYNQPRYYDVYDVNDPAYWDWEGETDVRLTLVYRRGENQFTHQFTFHRKKM